jgi:hypothetical protein
MRKLKIKIFSSFEEADKAYLEETLAMTPEQRIAATNEIRRRLFAIKGIKVYRASKCGAQGARGMANIRSWKRNKDGKEEPYE